MKIYFFWGRPASRWELRFFCGFAETFFVFGSCRRTHANQESKVSPPSKRAALCPLPDLLCPPLTEQNPG